MTLDGKTLLRVNHMDLDIYLEMSIDNQVFALHCFPELLGGQPEETQSYP